MIQSVLVFGRVIDGFMNMNDRVAYLGGRAVPRIALTGLALISLSACSADVTRFEASNSPFTNPFSSAQTAQATPPAGAAPSGSVASAPLAAPTQVASAPLPAPSAPRAVAADESVRGSAAGWSAVGGTPVVVAQGDSLNTLSHRYGVPATALLSANGLSSPAEVKPGARIIVPVYSGGGERVAAGKAVEDKVGKARKGAEAVAANDASGLDAKAKRLEDKAKAKGDKLADKGKADRDLAEGKSGLPKKTDAPVVAKLEQPKPEAVKPEAAKGARAKANIDNAPTGAVDPKAAGAQTAAAEADASGSNPEFRWPARGRIIQGFKTGGNDGIDISVPSGTSVRAAESGVVVYSGDGLKGYGNLVLIKHPNGYVTAYGNNGELDVKRGEQVKRGQIIAKSGDSGNVNSPQLHFELRKGSTPVDPTSYLAGL